MKLGMTSLTLRDKAPEEVIKYAKEAGLCGIEWGVSENHVILNDEASWESIRRLSDKYGIEIFSLGSYCRMTDSAECDKVIEAAHVMNAPIIRIWAGEKSPSDCSDEYISLIVKNTVHMAEKAEKYGIKLGFEYHSYTLTETAETAISLIKRINRPNVGLYWQPDSELSPEKNVTDRNMVLPYCCGNMHIQNFTLKDGYMLIEEIDDLIKLYFGDIKGKDYRLMIEFVKDSSPENLFRDASTLKKLIG